MRYLVLLLSLLVVVSCCADPDSWSKKLTEARQIHDSRKKSLSEDERRVVEQYVALLEKKSAGTDAEMIDAYEKLYASCEEEYKAKRSSILFKEFHLDYSGIPLTIAQICRDSSQITTDEKTTILLRQQKANRDARIAQIVIDHMKTSQSYSNAIQFCATQIEQGNDQYTLPLVQLRLEYIKTHESYANAIDFCLSQIATGNDQYLIPLAEIRVEYQLQLIQQALDGRKIEQWEPSVLKHGQLYTAFTEARHVIERKTELIEQYDRVFYAALVEKLNTEEDKKEGISFYEFLLDKASSLDPKNAELVARLTQHANAISKKVGMF